jgi:hypothetical protein
MDSPRTEAMPAIEVEAVFAPVLGAAAPPALALVVVAAQTAPSNWKAPTDGQVLGRATPRASVVMPKTDPPEAMAGEPGNSARVGTAPPLF